MYLYADFAETHAAHGEDAAERTPGNQPTSRGTGHGPVSDAIKNGKGLRNFLAMSGLVECVATSLCSRCNLDQTLHSKFGRAFGSFWLMDS